MTEIISPKYCDIFEQKVDLIQVGARNMQNYDLLKEVGKLSKPVLLKRGLSSTYEEWLMAAEYILNAGNPNVILCERGIRTFEDYTRNTLDISAIPSIKKMSHLPVIVDPSHSGGMRWLVEPLTLAAIAAGADGHHRGGAQRSTPCPVRRSAVSGSYGVHKSDGQGGASGPLYGKEAVREERKRHADIDGGTAAA